jgi:two-component system, chemotaxis family, response regulator Rcp1
VVEDNTADIRLLEEALRERRVPVNVVVAENAVQAYEALACRGSWAGCPQPTAILLDLNLPIISGHKVLQIVRQHDAWKHIPVVVFTSSKAREDREICTSLGASDYLAKPPTFEGYLAVAEVLRTLLAGKHRRTTQG